MRYDKRLALKINVILKYIAGITALIIRKVPSVCRNASSISALITFFQGLLITRMNILQTKAIAQKPGRVYPRLCASKNVLILFPLLSEIK